MEMVTNENDWYNTADAESGELFGHLPKNEKFDIITGYASAIILLLRLRGMTVVTVPMEITGSTFEELHNAKENQLRHDLDLLKRLLNPL